MGNFYSLTGVYFNDDSSVDFFGGYFLMQENDDYFLGQLIDRYGSSSIEGLFSDDFLMFNQKYFRSKDFIEYDFEYDEESDLWVGGFMFPSGKVGDAHCVVSHVFKKINLRGMPRKKIFLGHEFYEILTPMDINELNLD